MDVEEVPITAIEQYFNRLIDMQLLSQVVITDKEGCTIIGCFGPFADGEDLSSIAEDEIRESNVVLSSARCFQNLEQLSLGTPEYISAQYHDAIVLQTQEQNTLLTLIGYRSKGHCLGDLLALLPQIRSNTSFQELMQTVGELLQ